MKKLFSGMLLTFLSLVILWDPSQVTAQTCSGGGNWSIYETGCGYTPVGTAYCTTYSVDQGYTSCVDQGNGTCQRLSAQSSRKSCSVCNGGFSCCYSGGDSSSQTMTGSGCYWSGGGGESPPPDSGGEPPPREEPPRDDDSGPPPIPTSGAQMPSSSPDDGGTSLPTSTPASAPPGDSSGDEPPDQDPCVLFPRLPGCGRDSDPPVRRYDISGMIWYDYDQNRKQNEGEPGLDGVRVKADGQDDKDHADTNNKGKYEIKNLLEGRYRVEANLPGGFKATTKNPRLIGLRGNVRDVNFGAFRGYEISGRVFADVINRNGIHDSGEPWLKELKVVAQHKRSRSVGDNATTDRSGKYTISEMPNGEYEVSIENLNRNWEPVGRYPQEVRINFGNERVDFALFPQWTVEGRVFIDGNKDFHFGQYNPEDKPLGRKMTNLRVEGRDLTLTENNRENVELRDNGTYFVRGVVPGRYSIRYNPPNGMLVVFPRVGGTVMEYAIEIGDGGGFRCTDGKINPSGGDGRCTNNGSVTDLNFALAFSDSWIQGYGLDIRFDQGLTNRMPQTPDSTCGGGAYVSAPSSSQTPGVVFSGTVINPRSNFGQGQASRNPYNWLVGGTYKDTYASGTSEGALQTSYAQVKARILRSGKTITPLAGSVVGCSSLSACTLTGLPGGVYEADGDVTIDSWDVTPGSKYVILVKGNLIINGEISIPQNQGSSAMFSASDNIRITSTVGDPPTACPTLSQSNVDGFYSTDDNFIIEKAPDCATELMLSMQGAVVVNASLQGGTFQNNRYLCSANDQFPAFTIRERLDLILNAPDEIKSQNYLYQELAP